MSISRRCLQRHRSRAAADPHPSGITDRAREADHDDLPSGLVDDVSAEIGTSEGFLRT
jgi:hypothetical protein